ncbi:Neuronal calcium sensor 2 [Schistosoma japonicum]|nr:Neuronal calcium sensor 2 [Schistosoma japonicum]
MGTIHSNKGINKTELKKLSAKTHFTEAQIKKWYKGFIKDCPSGLLNRSTFLSMYTQFFPDGKARLFYEHLFRTFDQDASGSIDFNEFLTAIHLMVGDIDEQNSKTPAERTRTIFTKMDINSDSVLTKEEFIQGCLSDEHLYRLLAQNEGQKQ